MICKSFGGVGGAIGALSNVIAWWRLGRASTCWLEGSKALDSVGIVISSERIGTLLSLELRLLCVVPLSS